MRLFKKRGHWIFRIRYSDHPGSALCECSYCRNIVWVYDDPRRRFKYCPMCGAEMKEERSEE